MKDELISQIRAETWKFAKTYAKSSPHEYILRANSPDLYNKIRKYVEDEGVDEPFYSRTFRYGYLGEYKYWYYDDLINRTPVDEYTEDEITYNLAKIYLTGKA